MKKLFLIIVSLPLPPASALAADLQLPFKSPAETFSWTGFYVGGNAGGAWGSERVSQTLTAPPACRPVTIINGAIGSAAARWISSISACAASTPATSPSRVLCPAVRWDRPPHFLTRRLRSERIGCSRPAPGSVGRCASICSTSPAASRSGERISSRQSQYWRRLRKPRALRRPALVGPSAAVSNTQSHATGRSAASISMSTSAR